MPFVKNLGKTNMLTHIPEDIKLELKDGVLTLKAGSKVYVPNGFEKVTKYYKDIITTKYWKEITTGSKELAYACYSQDGVYGIYAKIPFDVKSGIYSNKNGTDITTSLELVSNPNDVGIMFTSGYWSSLSEDSATYNVINFGPDQTSPRYREGDLYIDTTVTETVEGTPEDYTYTTTETTTIEVGADDDWTRFEEIDTSVKKFDVVTAATDIIYSGSAKDDTVMMDVSYDTSTFEITAIHGNALNLHFSGNTPPSLGLFYNITDNTIKVYIDGSVNRYGSFPIAIINRSSTSQGSGFVKSLDQVFNGFGYIGSSVFALPGVKGLIPNGKNADGTLKNIEFTVDNVKTSPMSGTFNNGSLVFLSNGTWGLNYYTYDSVKNCLIHPTAGEVYDRLEVALLSNSSGTITSFNPKKVGEGYVANTMYNLARKGKHYFKNIYMVNTTKTGSLTINNCVVSGFSSSNYLSFPSISLGSNPWEVLFKATTGSSVSGSNGLFGTTGTGLIRCTTANSKLACMLSNSSSSFNIGTLNSRTLSANTTYWFKIAFTGSQYTLHVSTNGKDYTLDASISSTAVVSFTNTMYIGYARDGAWGGSIDLKESYISVSGKVVWDNKFVGTGTSTDYDWSVDKLISYAPIVRGSRTYYKQSEKQSATGTYTFTLDKEYTAKMLFVGNGGGGCSSQKDSRWHYSSGGSGACFEGLVRLPADTYTLTIGSLGYGNNRDNVHYHSSSVVSTDSYLTNSAGQELIRVGAGGNGYTSVGGVGGAAGVLALGTLDILETKKATDGVYTAGNTSAGSVSAYDGTYTGYGAGTGAQRGQGNVYGIKGIFDLVLETDINDYTYYVDVATKIY